MDRDVIPFAFCDTLLRCTMKDGEPWFVAADVCRILEIKQASRAVEPLDDDEKGVISTPTPGGQQQMLIISESGFYTIVLRSRQATTPGTVAHRFRKWVTSEVLPSLRRTGKYAAPVPLRTSPAPEIGDKGVRRVRRLLQKHGSMKLSELTYYTANMPGDVRRAALEKLEAEGFVRREIVESNLGRPATVLHVI